MDPILITPETLAAEAADRWAEQYGRGTYGTDKLVTLERLRALGPSPLPAEVDATIGNSSWTRLGPCNGCGTNDAPVLVQVGEELDYESSTARLREPCLRAALALFAPNPPTSEGEK